MTLEERKKHEQNMNALKMVFDELGLNIIETGGDEEYCNCWVLANIGKITATAYLDDFFTVEYTCYARSTDELKENIKKLLTIN